MISTTYEERKNEIIKVYEEYLKIREKHDDNNKISVLEQKVTDIKNRKFVLMIAGEAKSGKSTFINAFLGAKILPMDVKQCTSAIIEICHSSEYKLEAIHANGEKHFEVSEGGIQSFLQKHAALNDNYRHIPVPAINNQLLVKLKGEVRENDIKAFINNVKDDNIHRLSEAEYEKLIREYINLNKPKWHDIIVKIKVNYPFSDKLKAITIIDSPGVNALGKVGYIAEDYIENANAIIFTKSLVGTAIASTAFKNFFDSKSGDRHKETLFLVLTRAADLSEEELYNLKNEAVSMYGVIPREKIIAVDSKVQLYHNICTNMKEESEIDAYFKKFPFDSARICWLEARGVKSEFLNALRQKANFGAITNALEKFAMKTQFLSLVELLTLIGNGYSTMLKNFEERIELNKKNMEDPAKLREEIELKQEEINTLHDKFSEGIENIVKKYTDHERGEIIKRANEEFLDFEQSIAALESNFDKLERISYERIRLFKEYRENLEKNLITECDNELIKLTDKTTLHFDFFAPSFSKKDFENIKAEKEKDAYTTEAYEEGWTFKETKSRRVLSDEKHFKLVKDSILRRMKGIKSDICSNLQDYTVKITETYKRELLENINKKRAEYDSLLDRKFTNDQLQKEIEEFEQYLMDIKKPYGILAEIKGGIEHVLK